VKSRKALREKILKGLDMAFEKLVKERRENDDYLIFSENGKIVKVKARKIKLKRKAS
jgi:hypothetical protein